MYLSVPMRPFMSTSASPARTRRTASAPALPSFFSSTTSNTPASRFSSRQSVSMRAWSPTSVTLAMPSAAARLAAWIELGSWPAATTTRRGG